jgi:hypothetical protein
MFTKEEKNTEHFLTVCDYVLTDSINFIPA